MNHEALLRSQHDLQGRIARAGDNLKKAGTAKLTLGIVESRMLTLDGHWRKFESNHELLGSIHWKAMSEHKYFRTDLYGAVEETYLVQRGSFKDLLTGMRARAAEDAPATPTHASFSEHPKRSLPRIELPTFSGAYEQWPSFRDLFRSMIENDATLSKIEKLHYLRTSLKGEADQLVRNLPTTEDNFQRAWTILNDHYENTRLLVRSCFSTFTTQPHMKNESASDLRRIYHSVLHTVGSLEALGRPISSNSNLFVHLVVEMLDVRSRREWETAIAGTSAPPSICKLKEFLERRVRTLEALQPPKHDDNGASSSKSGGTARASARSLVTQKPGQEKGRCILCQKSHYIASCAEFQGKTPEERREVIKSNQLCYNCLGKHQVSTCPSKKSCTACGKRHHTTIHDSSTGVTDTAGATASATSLHVQHSREEKPTVLLATARVDVADNQGDRHTARALIDSGSEVSIVAESLAQRLRLARTAATTSIFGMGADVFATIIEEGLRKHGTRTPIAQQTTLGWILSGMCGTPEAAAAVMSLQCRADEELAALVRRFWEQEEPPGNATPLTEAERRCEEHFVKTHTRLPDGRFMVRLPTTDNMPALGESRGIAVRVQGSMERLFRTDANLKQAYTAFMTEYEELGHLSPAPPAPTGKKKLCYLPHHGVFKQHGDTGKIRVVFNGSARLPSGESLNAHLLPGPNLLPALPDVLTRWRMHKFVMVTDMVKMYRQILVHPDDRDLQRIVWRPDETAALRDYLLNTVTYGEGCAPFLAIRSRLQLARDERVRFPRAAAVLEDDTYVDNAFPGAETLEEALELQTELIELCMAGGLPLSKWSANSDALLATIPEKHRQPRRALEWGTDEGHSILGLQWQPEKDTFAFQVHPATSTQVTKRSVLSHTARLFDPLGWLAPVIIGAKILIQSTWLQGLKWDQPLATRDEQAWLRIQTSLNVLERIRIPRLVSTGSEKSKVKIHGFADASERAYAAVIYIRTMDGPEDIKVSLLMAKSKVAPTRPVTLPRLELSAAALLSKLAKHARSVTGLTTANVTLWSDSETTLAWIRGHPSRWKIYVANRVAFIQETLPDAKWQHLPGAENPADCASRGITPEELLTHDLWWQGPLWLKSDLPAPAARREEEPEDIPEQRARVHAATTGPLDSEMLLRFSTLHRLLRVSAWCLRWPRATRPRLLSVSDTPLSRSELEGAQKAWVRQTHRTWFSTELKAIEANQPIPSHSPVKKLSPFRDAEGILRVGGRLKHAVLCFDQQHPAILPRASHLTSLIINACHQRTLHGGVQLTLSRLRQLFWVPGGRASAKACIHRCTTCARWRAASPQPLMADLPAARVTASRPFTHVGVDYAGPVLLRTSKGRGLKANKAFLAIFVCFSTKATHLEVVSDYTTDAFLAAFRRLVSRRGLCSCLYSDRGTNFVGADAQLRAFFKAATTNNRISNVLANEGVEWRFNPPAAPHFGGLWEAAVKSVKHHLRRVIGDTTLTYEEMATLLAQVEATLNSRPLQALSDDHEDLSALTPGHFLIGGPLNTNPEPSLTEVTPTRLSRWQTLQQMRDHFWLRWSQEYLNTLTTRSKWWKKQANLNVGDLCLIRNEITPPSKWPLARITATHPGADGQTRVVTVKTATSSFTRPVTKLVPLPGVNNGIGASQNAEDEKNHSLAQHSLAV
ncbi:uncharacterized protein [Temnothorax longispinosus]|uniref:uncharacterized protein n=1 Tax=Temnothorax longispinosus TaxID=300112 RepID=UPI003A9A1507